jgi:hypothetical protein
MTAKRRLLKTVDEVVNIRCAAGVGLLREEVWEDEDGNVQRYNLAFINHFMTSKDNGRVLGYDNGHGHHHRHFKGNVETVSYHDYKSVLARFILEVDELKREKQ